MVFTSKYTKFWDGWASENDLNLLQCLVDVNTGEYIYFPQKKD